VKLRLLVFRSSEFFIRVLQNKEPSARAGRLSDDKFERYAGFSRRLNEALCVVEYSFASKATPDEESVMICPDGGVAERLVIRKSGKTVDRRRPRAVRLGRRVGSVAQVCELTILLLFRFGPSAWKPNGQTNVAQSS